MHPLIGDLTTLTDDEITTKLNLLSKKLNQSYRLGYHDAISQLQLIMQDYNYELQRRNTKRMEEIMERSNKTGGFDGLIDVS
jgi:hypothetical protein